MQHRSVAAGRDRKLDGVIEDLLIHKNAVRLRADRRKLAPARNAVHGVHHAALLLALKQIELRLGGRITEGQPDHKAVHLRFGQHLRAARPDRVLRGDDDERIGHRVRYAVDGHTALLHCLEQRGLGAARGAVQLVRKEEVAKDGAGLVDHFAGRLVEQRKAHDVRRKNVRRELDALVIEAERFAERDRHRRFPHARDILEQDMPARYDGDQCHRDNVVLADDRFFYFVQYRFRSDHGFPPFFCWVY